MGLQAEALRPRDPIRVLSGKHISTILPDTATYRRGGGTEVWKHGPSSGFLWRVCTPGGGVAPNKSHVPFLSLLTPSLLSISSSTPLRLLLLLHAPQDPNRQLQALLRRMGVRPMSWADPITGDDPAVGPPPPELIKEYRKHRSLPGEL